MSLMVGNSVGQLFGIYGLYLNFIWQQKKLGVGWTKRDVFSPAWMVH
jgi:hypothetical protein